NRAGVVVAVENLLPAFAAVLGAEDAAFLVRSVRMPERRDVHEIGFGGMDTDARDGRRVMEAHVQPRLSRVGRAVHAVSLHDVAPKLGLATADVHHIGIGGSDGNRADRRAFDLAVGDGPPVESAIDGLPESAASGAEVILVRSAGRARGGNRASTTQR